MNLIQSAVQVSSEVAKPDAPVPTGPGQNTFAEALQSLQNSADPPTMATGQTKPVRGPSQADLNIKDSGQNWTIDGIPAGLPIVPLATEFAKTAGPPIAQNAKAAATSIKRTASAPTPTNVPSFCRNAGTKLNPRSISGASDAAAPIGVLREPCTAKLTAHAALAPSAAPSPSPAPAVHPEAAASVITAFQGSPLVNVPQTISPTGAVSAPVIPTSASPIPEIAPDQSTAAAAECDQQSNPTQPVGTQAVPSEPDSEFSVPDFQSSTAAPQLGVQQFDKAAPDIPQAMPQPDATAPPPDGMLAAQTSNAGPIDSNRQSSAARPYFAIPIKPAGTEATERSVDPTETFSPNSAVAPMSSKQHGPTSTTAAPHTFPLRLNPGQAPGVVQTQESEPATHSRMRQHNLDSGQPATPETGAVPVLNDVSHATFSSPLTDTHVATPKAPCRADKGSGESQSPSGQGIPAPGASDVSTKSTPVTNPQAAPPLGPDNIQAQSRTVEEPNSGPAINLVTTVSKAQPGASSPAGADRAAPPPRTDQPVQSETVNAGVVAARMVEGIGQSDMHIGLRTQAFGTVNVHTALRDAQVGLAVSSEKGDLRSFFSSEMPALQSALRQHDLHFENIKFIQSGNSASAFSANTNSGSHSSGQRPASMPGFSPDDVTEEDRLPEDISLEIPARLSVHA